MLFSFEWKRGKVGLAQDVAEILKSWYYGLLAQMSNIYVFQNYLVWMRKLSFFRLGDEIITAIAVAVSCCYVEIMLCRFNVIKHARLIKMVYVTKHVEPHSYSVTEPRLFE